MKLAWLGVVAFCGTAAADPMIDVGGPPAPPEQTPRGASLEAGVEVGRVAFTLPGQMTLTHATDEAVHFGPRISLSRNFYLAIGIDGGRFNATGPQQAQILSPVPGGSDMIVPLSGSFTAVTGAVGVREFVGVFSGGVELGGGVRYLSVHDENNMLSQTFFDGIGVAAARVEFWMTPRLTLAATSEIDLEQAHDFGFGLMVGLHALPYDAAR